MALRHHASGWTNPARLRTQDVGHGEEGVGRGGNKVRGEKETLKVPSDRPRKKNKLIWKNRGKYSFDKLNLKI